MTTYVSATHHKENLTAEYNGADGSKLLKIGGSINWRFNNPGNIRPAKANASERIGEGETKSGKFCIFASYEAGRAAKKALLRRAYGDDTIPSMMERYAPRSENDTDSYTNFLLNKTGISKNQKVGQMSDSETETLMNAMQAREGYKAGTEKILGVSDITLTDGARPLPNIPVQVEVNGKKKTVTTTKEGKVPVIVHKKTGEKVTVSVQDNKGQWKPVTLFGSTIYKGLMLVKDLFVFTAKTEKHISSKIFPTKKSPVRYVVEPKDTLSIIATKFKTSISKIQQDNEISDPNKIYPGQVLSIGGTGAEKSAKAATPVTKSQSSSNKSSKPPKKEVPTVPVDRTQEGAGHPVGVIPYSQKTAPWMEIAVREAKQWAGVKESTITKTDNYHKETGANTDWTLSVSWCASFVNYCYQEAGYAKSKAIAGSQSFTYDSSFKKISSPIYGAIAVFANPKKPGQGHVTFVYAKLDDGDYAVLGGNQGDSITLNPLKKVYTDLLAFTFKGYYVPLAYYEHAQEIIKNGGDLTTAYVLKSLKASLNDKSGLTSGTR